MIVEPPVAKAMLLRPVADVAPPEAVVASLVSRVIPALVETTTPFPKSDESAKDTAPPE